MTQTDRSIVVMAYGQSNADVHTSGPRLDSPAWDDPGILVPDDGRGIRGLMGTFPHAPFDGFSPAGLAEPRNQSLLLAAAARLRHELGPAAPRVVIRSAAKGGRRLLGIRQKDRNVTGLLREVDGRPAALLRDFLNQTRAIVAACAARGHPAEAIYVLWLHGESDRAMGAQEYAALVEELVGTVTDSLGDLGLPVRWLSVQPGGTSGGGTGSLWPNRQAQLDPPLSQIAPAVAAGYLCDYVDQMHYGPRGKAYLGEWLGHVIAQYHQGVPYRLPPPPRAERSADGLMLRFDPDRAPLAQGDAAPDGLVLMDRMAELPSRADWAGDRAIRVTPVVTTMDSLCAPRIAYAYRRNAAPDRSVLTGRAFATGNLRTTYEIASILAPGTRLWEPIPAFCIDL